MKGELGAVVYLLRLRSGGIYVGCTMDLEQRMRDHEDGVAGRTTCLDPVVGVVWTERFEDFSIARRREGQIKRWSRAKKEALVVGDVAGLRRLARSRDHADVVSVAEENF